MKIGGILALVFLTLASFPATAEPINYVYSGDANDETLTRLLQRPNIAGLQRVYAWKQLESEKGVYDFSDIESDLARTDALGKKLFIQVQDRFFSVGARRLPQYLLEDEAYGGGLAPQVEGAKQFGWVAIQWNEALRDRYQALLSALAKTFDGRIAGINLPETAAEIDKKSDKTGFTCDGYFKAELDNIRHARNVFKNSEVVQYVNFWPCEWNNDHGYMEHLFKAAKEDGFGLGGPDIVPWRKGQMKNSYPFFHEDHDRLSLVAMAIQEPTLKYKNDRTGKPYTRAEFLDFAENYLGVDIIFWTPDAPWLSAN